MDYARVINEMIGKRLSFQNRNKCVKMYYALHMNGSENIATREILEMARTTEVEESAVEHFLLQYFAWKLWNLLCQEIFAE